MAAGLGGPPLRTLMYSTNDGLTWTLATYAGIQGTGRAVAWNGSLWMAGGSAGAGPDSVAVSSDGINWTGLGKPGPGGGLADVYAVANNGLGRWVIGGVGLPAAMLYTDDDGGSWTNIGQPVPFCRGIAYSSSLGRWVAVGDTNGFPTPIAITSYSNDGFLWTSTLVTPFTTTCNGVAWNGSYWLAVGVGTTNVFATSLDGITWTGQGNTVYDTLGNPVVLNGVRSVAWDGSLWVAAASSSNSTLTSPDGITWTIRDSTNLLNGANAVTYTGTAWIVGGSQLPTNASIRSTNALTWTSIPTPFNNIEGLASQFVAPPPPPTPSFVPSQTTVPQEFQNVHLPSHNNIVPYYRGAVVPGIPNIQPPPPGTFKEPRQAKDVISRCFGSLVPNKNVPDPCAHPRSPHEKRDIQQHCSGVIPVADYNARLNNYQRPFGTYQVGFQQSPKSKVVATWPPLP